jgi:hypothetical protein
MDRIEVDGRPVTLDELRELDGVFYSDFANSEFRLVTLEEPCPEPLKCES